MRNAALLLLILVFAAISQGASAFVLSYQGRLVNSSGAALPDGPHSMTFQSRGEFAV